MLTVVCTADSPTRAVSCTSQVGVKVAARSGHSYDANGVRGEDSPLVIDHKNLIDINVTASNQKAVFMRRIRIGYLALALVNGHGAWCDCDLEICPPNVWTEALIRSSYTKTVRRQICTLIYQRVKE